MKIDMEVTTEQARDNFNTELDRYGRSIQRVQKDLEYLDKKILAEILRKDPKIENSYLKRVQIQQNDQIRKLQHELNITNEKLKLAKEVVRLYQQGIDVKKALTVITAQALREGIL